MYNFDFKLYVVHENIKYELSALCEGNVTLTSSRKNSPSNLTFKILRSAVKNGIAFGEGDFVSLVVNGTGIFKGRIFIRSRTKDQIITVTAYDQIRYLQNKKTYEYTNKKVGDVVKMIAGDFKLTTGVIEDTGYVISKRREEDETLIDIILNAIDITTINTKELYVLFDDFGELSLRNIKSMFIPLCISDDGTMIDFNYKTDIDSDTYNSVKLYRDNEKTKKRDVYQAYDSATQKQWGVLQYYENLPEIYNDAQAKNIAENILRQKNRVHKTMSVECIGAGQGEEKIRGGSVLVVDVNDVGENAVFNTYIVESCTHTFSNNQHSVRIDISEWND